MRSLNAAVASLSLVLVTIVAALPWGLSPQLRFILPQIPFVAIHIWMMREEGAIAVWLILICGLSIDVVSGGPLGYWSLTYLVGYVLAAFSWPLTARDSWLGRWGHFTISAVLLAAFEWALAALYYLEFSSVAPFALAAGVAIALYPIASSLLRLFASEPARPAFPPVVRGR